MAGERGQSDVAARGENPDSLGKPLQLVDVAKLLEPGRDTVQHVLEISRALAIHRWRYAT